MDVREAILKAADHIESNPQFFNFDTVRVPGSCRTPGCALGWIGHFAGVEGSIDQLRNVLGVNDWEFYERMNQMNVKNSHAWTRNAKTCARLMRLYADKYYPTPTQLGIPDSVRAIFDATQSVAAN